MANLKSVLLVGYFPTFSGRINVLGPAPKFWTDLVQAKLALVFELVIELTEKRQLYVTNLRLTGCEILHSFIGSETVVHDDYRDFRWLENEGNVGNVQSPVRGIRLQDNCRKSGLH